MARCQCGDLNVAICCFCWLECQSRGSKNWLAQVGDQISLGKDCSDDFGDGHSEHMPCWPCTLAENGQIEDKCTSNSVPLAGVFVNRQCELLYSHLSNGWRSKADIFEWMCRVWLVELHQLQVDCVVLWCWTRC